MEHQVSGLAKIWIREVSGVAKFELGNSVDLPIFD